MKTVSAVELDGTDRKMLRLLQQDGRMTNADLARQVALSESACLRRLRALEAAGVVDHYAAVISERAVGLPISVFVTVTLSSQSEAALSAFEQAVAAAPEVMECYLMTGDADYQLRVIVSSLTAFEEFLRHKLTRIEGVGQVTTSFALRPIIYKTAIPVGAGKP